MKIQDSEDFKRQVKGKIIYLNEAKGWGYINSHEIQFSKVYFHWTGLNASVNFKELKRHDEVVFKAMKREKGWKAINIDKA